MGDVEIQFDNDNEEFNGGAIAGTALLLSIYAVVATIVVIFTT